MPEPNTLVGNITITKKIKTNTGFIVFAEVEDLGLKQTVIKQFNFPLNFSINNDLILMDEIRNKYIKIINNKQKEEMFKVLDGFRNGKNILRDSNGNKRDLNYLTYDEVTYRLYLYLTFSNDPKDKIIAAQMTQSLTDQELMTITGLDAVGVQDIRNKANAALQAYSLMQQAGGNF